MSLDHTIFTRSNSVLMTVLECANCGTELELGSRYCPLCGTNLSTGQPPASQNRATCPSCAAEIPPDARRCGRCAATSSPTASVGATVTLLDIPAPPARQIRATPTIPWIVGGVMGMLIAGLSLSLGSLFGVSVAGTVTGGFELAFVCSLLGIVVGVLANQSWPLAHEQVGSSVGRAASIQNFATALEPTA